MFILENIDSVSNLGGLARQKSKHWITKTVSLTQIEEYQLNGWIIEKKYEKSVRMKKEKFGKEAIEDRIWSLIEKMGFSYLNGGMHAKITNDSKTPNGETSTIDVVGIDMEVAVGIWCKTLEDTETSLRDDLDYCISARQRFVQSVRRQYPLLANQKDKRQIATALFAIDIPLSEEDEIRAKNGEIIIFREQELRYYEELVAHLGTAARYQFLADMLPGKHIPGLNITVPAIKTKVGEYTFYTFPISPESLLKIAYVSHRAKGAKSDVTTYQRAIQKSRLKKIQQYLDDKNIFPTNIIINFEKKLRFDKSPQETDQEAGIMGWLRIEGEYKSAWIIDGQHRLFAYSGHRFAETARLSVLAFEMLPPSTQAQLFVDINYQQKSVKKSLLNELYGVLHEDAEEPEIKTRAVISQIISLLDNDPKSPFYQRIQASDESKSELRCISSTSMFSALSRNGFYIKSKRKGLILYGPLWSEEGNEAMRTRSMHIINSWFNILKSSVPDWWNAGKAPGGGLAMNDGVTSCFIILRDVIRHIENKGIVLVEQSKEELVEQLKPYAQLLGDCFQTLTEDRKAQFRTLRGSQGQSTQAKRWEQIMYEKMPSFNPPGLQDFIKAEEMQTNLQAKKIIDEIENTLKETIIEELKSEFGNEETQWWIQGIPQKIREETAKKYERAGADRGKKENYFNFIDYKEIILYHWNIFEKLFSYGKSNVKREIRISWVQKVNDARNIVAHSSSGRSVTPEQLAELENYVEWLRKQVKALDQGEETSEEEYDINL